MFSKLLQCAMLPSMSSTASSSSARWSFRSVTCCEFHLDPDRQSGNMQETGCRKQASHDNRTSMAAAENTIHSPKPHTHTPRKQSK